jgi:chaperonin GroES
MSNDNGHEPTTEPTTGPTHLLSVDQFTPTVDRVLVKRHPKQSTTKGGLALPDNAQNFPYSGTIVSVGEKVETLRPSDVVSIPEYAGALVRFSDQDHSDEYVVLREKDVLGYVRSL